MNDMPPVAVKVWGDFACFTRPEMKVERVSYPVPTPSAARGMLEAIFWKPEFRWRVTEIQVLRPIRWFSILRNEVNTRASAKAARAWATKGGGFFATENRAQRHTLALRDVEYVIKAEIDLRPHATDPPAKYRAQFRRRVERGQCFNQPYLGCREFAASFSEPSGREVPIKTSSDIGLILHDLVYEADGTGEPRFFEARLDGGVLRVPAFEGVR